MNTELKTTESLLMELQEAEMVDVTAEDGGTYSITYAFGGVYIIICC